MEGITRLVSESLARHGFDRPLDYRRLHWSQWFRCESPHSLLLVPSKPGVFALAEEITDFDSGIGNAGTGAVSSALRKSTPLATVDAQQSRRMLAVTQFFEDDDMAFVLDRMMARPNAMRERLASGRYFVRFVVIQDIGQRRSICSALNQWIANSSERASGIGAHFASSLELASVTGRADKSPADADAARTLRPATGAAGAASSSSSNAMPPGPPAAAPLATNPNLDSGAHSNVHCPSPFPSGF